MTTGFFWERCFWHRWRQLVLLPVGGLVQLPDGGPPESPEQSGGSNLIEVTGFLLKIHHVWCRPATREDLLRVHPAH
jgi:hypothetical protein